ncbi:hypothetical protein BT93_L5399 [Corymbia citriodora subsp. variegata]|uniref:Uncharacterized protein n=1 Tax=Corymbia citriodora subsp. variegata TaxID=360336 RepID=A0A8T0CXE2_CORYI|nr:hypothetical protein BT93_L5399 [Corymbia citriodora subsp. variegata]
MATKRKHLSSIASDVVQKCALRLGTSVDGFVEEFEAEWTPDSVNYSRKFVEFCSSKAVIDMCPNIGEKISDGSFSRLTFNMMLAWEMPSSADEEPVLEAIGKEKEDKKQVVETPQDLDDIPLFYSDLMPLLVDHGPDVGEDAFVWLASLFPLVADIANGKFTFETLTAPTGSRLHFPAYDKYLKEIDKCIRYLQKQEVPRGVDLVDDELILHVEGTASTQRVVRHIGGQSWPGRLTLTNYALYFEASGVITYEDAIKIDLSKDAEHTVKPAATGPFGAPLFDKAMVYESPELSEGIVLEFPEMTSSTRRDHWLALTKEVMLMHKFLSRHKVESPSQAWELHSRMILGIVRLHAAREMLRISPPLPRNFLIFALFDELPKGDYVLEELAESLKKDGSRQPCSASSILRTINMSVSRLPDTKYEEAGKECTSAGVQDDDYFSLKTAINNVREEAREIEIAKASTEGLKEEGIGDSAAVLMELLKQVKDAVLPKFQEILTWQRPMMTVTVIAAALVIIYMEWINKAIAAGLFWLVLKMHRVRKERREYRREEIVVCTASDQSTVESIVSAQRGLQTVHDMMRRVNITLLKLQSIFLGRTRKHAEMVMMVTCAVAIAIAVIPLKYIFIGATLYGLVTTSKLGKRFQDDRTKRRLNEWWDSIPAVPVRVVDRAEDCPVDDSKRS